jgi:hypothetical protein
MSPDPVSWFVIEPGWAVSNRDGGKVGTIEAVLGDSELDIFTGLTVATHLLGKARYVPSERVAAIFEGEVRLDLTAAEVDVLEPYEPPAV